MNRDLSAISAKEFDLVVVGGGIFGICAAWDAVLRGLSVALLERVDFAHACSANSFKIIHGGIRYLQHADLRRLRVSSRERGILLRNAPHLVQPLPLVIPTYGRGMRGKAALRSACTLYDLLTLDRNRGIKDPSRTIPRTRSVSRRECLELFPGLKSQRLTGGIVFHDAQMHNPTRLALSYLRSAVDAGVVAANYLEVKDFLRRGDIVNGVRVEDRLGGGDFEVRGRVVLNATGSWVPGLLAAALDTKIRPPLTFSRDTCFVVSRRLTGDYGLAVLGETRDPDAIFSRKRRHLFIVPWRDCTLIGVWHMVFKGDPDHVTVSPEEVDSFLGEINRAYPRLGLRRDDLCRWHAGLVLFGDNHSRAKDLSFGKRSRIIDHAAEHGVSGLISLVGVRYTTARAEAEAVVDLACRKLGKRPPPSRTAVTPLFGGDIEDVSAFERRESAEKPPSVSTELFQSLLRNYGSEYRRLLRYAREDPRLLEPLDGSRVMRAEVIYAVREEMAHKLADVVFRRTCLGAAAIPARPALEDCTRLMGCELHWDDDRRQRELSDLEASFTPPLKAEDPLTSSS